MLWFAKQTHTARIAFRHLLLSRSHLDRKAPRRSRGTHTASPRREDALSYPPRGRSPRSASAARAPASAARPPAPSRTTAASATRTGSWTGLPTKGRDTSHEYLYLPLSLYLYIALSLSLYLSISLSLSLYIYIYIYICISLYLSIFSHMSPRDQQRTKGTQEKYSE